VRTARTPALLGIPLLLALLVLASCGRKEGEGAGPAVPKEPAKAPNPGEAPGAPPGVPDPERDAARKPPAPSAPEDWFVDEAKERGVDLLNQTGEPGKKQLIMAAVGPGGAIFDANGDGRMDLFIPNGSWLVGGKLDRIYDGEDRPRDALYIQKPDGTFRNEARERGVDDDSWSFGCCAADLDNDGDQDLVVTNLGANRLYENDGKGFFKDVAAEAGIAGDAAEWTTGASVGDYDRDGILDLYLSNYADLFRWMNDPQNRQIQRDAQGNILNAAVCDWQGLKVYCGPKGLPAQQDHLYRGLGGLRFEDVTRSSGVFRPVEEGGGPMYGFQVLFTDLTADGWPDLYVANDSVPSFFFENRRDGTFVECAKAKGIALGAMGEEQAGMGADSADMNGDGLLDILKTNFALQENNVYVAVRTPDGEIVFDEKSQAAGVHHAVWTSLGWGVVPFDYDNDGDLDVYFSNGHVFPEVDLKPELKMGFAQLNQLFRNDSQRRDDGTFRIRMTETTDLAGPGLRIRKSSRGAAMGDIDDDGDSDLLVINLNATPDLLINRLGSSRGHWLRLRFVGDPKKKTNRDAVGTKFWASAGGWRHFHELKRGQSFLSCHDPRFLLGLGDRTGPVTLEITWPNGDRETRTIEAVDREVTIAQ